MDLPRTAELARRLGTAASITGRQLPRGAETLATSTTILEDVGCGWFVLCPVPSEPTLGSTSESTRTARRSCSATSRRTAAWASPRRCWRHTGGAVGGERRDVSHEQLRASMLAGALSGTTRDLLMRRDGPSTLLIPAAKLELLLTSTPRREDISRSSATWLTIDRWHHLVSASAAAGRRQLG